MIIGIEINGVLRDTLKKIQEVYQKWYIDNPFLEENENTFEYKINSITDLSGNIENIPNQFIDPLICELIETPVVLPKTNIIVDEKIIYKHIVLKGDNPYNRDVLTIDELVKYQEEENTKNLVNSWKEEYKKWKSDTNFKK